jgi:hypothetical protein
MFKVTNAACGSLDGKVTVCSYQAILVAVDLDR